MKIHRKESGVAMLEVMVAIIVVSFGLLGLASLQLTGMKNSQTSYLRSIATAQAYNMADRMRANIAGVTAGEYDNVTTTIPARPDCSNPFQLTGGCTPAEMADYDAYIWLTNSTSLLPGGRGTITKIAGSSGFIISVLWDEKCISGESSCTSGNLTRSFSTRFVP